MWAPLMPSQQSSLRGTRTKFTCHDRMAAMVCGLSSGWPPNGSLLQPWAQTNSVPEMLTPRRLIGAPFAVTIRLPLTCSPPALTGPGMGVGDGEGLVDGDGLALGVGEADGDGDGDGNGDGEGDGEGLVDGDGLAEGLGGVGCGSGAPPSSDWMVLK